MTRKNGRSERLNEWAFGGWHVLIVTGLLVSLVFVALAVSR